MQKTYKNSARILFKILKNDFPMDVKMQNEKNVTLETYQGMYFQLFIKKYENVKYDLQKDLVEIEKKDSENIDKNIKFVGGVNNGDLINGFLGDDYGSIRVENKIVIDVGANIGDTPIYFVHSGAIRVIGIEPFPKNFELARKNIENNKMADKIQIILAGCASKKGFIRVDPDRSDTISTIDQNGDGEEIPLITIYDIVKDHNIPDDSVLKIDCEGCEYDIILNLPDSLFHKFSDIFIEYHDGYQEIKSILEKNGFAVEIKKPIATNVINSIFNFFSNKPKKSKIGYVGFIHATKNVLQNKPKSS